MKNSTGELKRTSKRKYQPTIYIGECIKLLFSFYSVFVSQLTAYVDSPLIGQSLLVGNLRV